jgi:hypothetical protein
MINYYLKTIILVAHKMKNRTSDIKRKNEKWSCSFKETKNHKTCIVYRDLRK